MARGNLSIMVHPNSGCEVEDHRDWALWLGPAHTLNFTCFHYDCPGCNINDCSARSDAVVTGADRDARRCGVAWATGGAKREAAPGFTVVNETLFCSSGCREWAQHELPRWLRDCPHNCDLFPDTASQRRRRRLSLPLRGGGGAHAVRRRRNQGVWRRIERWDLS